jgi:aminoglycoside 6'-N-acetyltransferase
MPGPRVTLDGLHVMVRPLEEADVPHLTRIVNEPGIREWWWGYDEARMRAETLEDDVVTPFAIELDGELIGLIMYTEELDPHYRFAMIDVTVDAFHVGQGLGTDALRTLARYLIEERGHHHIMIDPAAANARAIAAYTKVGFKPVGVMRRYELGPGGTWRDGLLMDLLAEELT